VDRDARGRSQRAAAGGGRRDHELRDHELARLVQTLPRDDPRREAACEQLVTRYQALVRSCAQRYRDSPEPFDELMQVGYVGLLKAINNFDTEVGESLPAYAQPCVSGEIKRYFRDKRWIVRAELATYLHVSEAEVREAQQASLAFQASSLDAPLPDGSEEGSLGDLLGEEDPALERTVDMEAVRSHWSELSRREQKLLMMRFYGNMTQAQIGDQLGISQMHVSRLLTRALDFLRERIADPRSAAPAGG